MPIMRIPYGVLDGRYINSAGDSMMGQLMLSGDPTSDLHAATKQYVDNADSQFLKIDGSLPLTANWDAGDFGIRAQTLQADVATGIPPLIISSTSKVSNLNVDQVDGYDLDQGVLTSSYPEFARLGLGRPSDSKNILSILSNSNMADNKAVDIENTGVVAGTGYGIRISKTGASTTNIAAHFSASGGIYNYGLIVSSGYAGIGTASPDRKLDILDAGAPQLRLAHTNGTYYTDFQTDNSGDLTIAPSGGDVKLPNCLLTINGPYKPMYGQLCIHGTTNNHAYQTIYYNNTFMGWYGLLSNSFGFCMYNDGSGGNMKFYSKAGQGESARFDVNGNMGIGTTGPDRKLDVLDSAAPQLRLTHTDGSVYSDFRTLSDGNLSILPSGGNIFIGSTAVNSLGTFVVDRSITSGTGNFRGFRDETTFSRSGTVAYCCFDAEASLNGSYDYDHIVGFQSRPRHTSTGTLSQLAGFSSVLYNSGGAVASAWGLRVYDVAGTGAVTNNYGVYINSLTRGANNYAIYTEGSTKSYIGGNLGIGTANPRTMLDINGDTFLKNIRLSNYNGSSTFESLHIRPVTTNASPIIRIMPNGSSSIGPRYNFFATDYESDSTNFEYLMFEAKPLDKYFFNVLKNGSGSLRPLHFQMNSSDVLVIATNNNVGINTTDPDRRLDILDASNPQLRLSHTDGNIYTDFQTTSDGGMKISPSGNKIGFFGVAPAARATAYTLSNVTTDRSYNLTLSH